jgi:hypothetical protein
MIKHIGKFSPPAKVSKQIMNTKKESPKGTDE